MAPLPAFRVIVQRATAALAIAGLGLGIGLQLFDDKTRRSALACGPRPPRQYLSFVAGIALGLIGFIDKTLRIIASAATSLTIAQGLVVLAAAVVIVRFLVLASEARQR